MFLILLYALVVLILSLIDFFANSYWAALGVVFFLHALIIFPGLMENKYIVAYVSSILMAIGIMVLKCYMMNLSPNPYPREALTEVKPEPNQLIETYGNFLAAVLPPHKS